MRSRWWVWLLVLAVGMAWGAWILQDARRDARADAAWKKADVALHDSLTAFKRRVVTLDSAVASLEARRAAAAAAVRVAERVADQIEEEASALRDSALAAVRDEQVSRDSLGALLRAMAALEIAREQAATAERAQHAARAVADSSTIVGLRAGMAARDSALAVAERNLAVKDQRIGSLEHRQGWRVRVAGGVVAYGVTGSCAAVGWIVMGPAGGIASGAACAVGWAVFGPKY